MRSRNS